MSRLGCTHLFYWKAGEISICGVKSTAIRCVDAVDDICTNSLFCVDLPSSPKNYFLLSLQSANRYMLASHNVLILVNSKFLSESAVAGLACHRFLQGKTKWQLE